MGCFWSCNWEKWSEVEDRPWKLHDNPDQTFIRYFQRRECKDCGVIQERQL